MSPPPVDRIASSDTPLVRVQGMTKSFGGVKGLRGVSLEVRAGEVHALLGENGAGKSTLIKILSGVHSFDSGAIEIEGAPVAFDSPTDSRKAGIAVVYQDLSLIESLSVGANLMLNREPTSRFGFLKKRQLVAAAADFLRRHKIPLDSRATAGSLPFAYRQMTEICKALMGQVRALILDEPTSALSSDEEQIPNATCANA
jgi:ribose transport system ATP-binding protein